MVSVSRGLLSSACSQCTALPAAWLLVVRRLSVCCFKGKAPENVDEGMSSAKPVDRWRAVVP